MSTEKVRENRLRRMARRQGFALRKSRTRDPYAISFGRYWLVDVELNAAMVGDQWGVDLDAIEAFLTARRRDR
jgi:hypothetical protein